MKFNKLIVTQKEIFKVAHEITRDTVRKGDSYSVTFAAVLKEIYIAIKLESEYAVKAFKAVISAFFNRATSPAKFDDVKRVLTVTPEDATTINQMSEEQVGDNFKKLSVSVISAIWGYMPFN